MTQLPHNGRSVAIGQGTDQRDSGTGIAPKNYGNQTTALYKDPLDTLQGVTYPFSHRLWRILGLNVTDEAILLGIGFAMAEGT